jgi:hypothetical protein
LGGIFQKGIGKKELSRSQEDILGCFCHLEGLINLTHSQLWNKTWALLVS